MKASLFILLIISIFLLGCDKSSCEGDPDKELPLYCCGFKTGYHTETGYPFMSMKNDTVTDSLYHVGFYFNILKNENCCDNRVIRYYGKTTIIEDIGYLWINKKVIYEEEMASLYDHHFQIICNGYYNDTFASNDTITYYIHYLFEIECLYKYDRDTPPICPMNKHITETILILN